MTEGNAMNALFLQFLVVFLLVLANGLFALSEMAIISARKNRLRRRAERGEQGAAAALRLAEKPTRFLSTVQAGITMIGILSGAVGGATIAEALAGFLGRYESIAPYSEELGVGIVVVLITYVSLILGELVPKRIALNNAERIAALTAVPMQWLSRIATPVVWLLSVSTEAVLRLIGAKPSGEPHVTEDDVRRMILEGTRLGVFDAAEQQIVERVFRLGDRRAGSLMTYRTQIDFLDLNHPLKASLAKIVDTGHARYPVCRGSLENLEGVLYVRDLFAQVQGGGEPDLQTVLRPPVFVPETLSGLKLLEFLREQKSPLVLVTDEYGGVTGLVTIHDVLTAIVGDIPMLEEVIDTPAIVQRPDGSYLLDGLLSAAEVRDLLQLDSLPDAERFSYDTLGGMLMACMGDIPKTGDVFTWQNWRFEVVDMDGYRVDKVLVSMVTG